MLRYKVPRIETRPRESRDEVVIEDPRFALDIVTDAFLNKLRLSNRANVTFSIPLYYDPDRNLFAVPERAQPVQSFIFGRYYGASLPTETAPGDYELAVDANHRLYVKEDVLEGALASKATDKLRVTVVDALPRSPVTLYDSAGAELSGYVKNLDTALSGVKAGTDYIDDIYIRMNTLYNPGDAETFTTTPLGANAAYYGPSRDFGASRLTTFGVMGYANQPSAANGVYIQLSLDGTNWDYIGATATLSAAGAVSLAQVVTARYARVVWVNGSTAQTAFRLGGRYMIAGSENPPVSLTAKPTPDPICALCGKDMTETSDFFVENGTVYCPKCYANKRWKEIDAEAQAAWQRALRAWLKRTRSEELKRVKDHTPDETEVM
jgi:hypothetical protein